MSLFRAPSVVSVIKCEMYETQRLLLQFEARAEEMQGQVNMYASRLARLKARLAEAEGKVDIPFDSFEVNPGLTA